MDRFNKLYTKLCPVPKVLYFTVAAAFYSFHQFRGQFITDRIDGMNKSNLGLYLSIPQFLSFFTNIYCASINDKFGKQKLLLASLFLGSASLFQTFFVTSTKVPFMILYTIYFCVISNTIPLLDKVMIDYVTNIPEMGAKTFGRQRIWSTFGYLFANFIVEHLITPDKSRKDKYDFGYLPYYNWAASLIAVGFIILFVQNVTRRESSSGGQVSLKPLIKNFEYMYFIGIIFLCGISRAFMTNYLGLYTSKVLKFENQKGPTGLAWPLSVIVELVYDHKHTAYSFFGVTLEVLVFFFSSAITDKLGLLWPLFLSQIFQLLRFVAYFYLPYDNENSFAFVCLIELLKGANYSLVHTSALQLANSFAPPNLKTTSQVIYNGVFVAIGTVASGVFFQGFFKDSADISQEEAYKEYHKAFGANIIFSLVLMGFFLFKYAIYENLLFSRENTKKKLEEIKLRANLDENLELEDPSGKALTSQV